MPCLPRRRHGGAHAGDTAFAVGDGAQLFPPGGGGQQQVGVGGGGRGGECILQHHPFRPLQCAAYGGLVRQTVGRVGAGDPQGFDLAVGSGFKQFDGGLAGTGRYAGHAPEGSHFGTVLRIGQIAVGAEQIGHASHFAAPHGIGLAGQRQRAGTLLADLAGGQVQIDQRGVLGRSAAALVQALAVQAERGGALGGAAVFATQCKPARGLQHILHVQAAVACHALGGGFAHQGLEGIETAGVAGDVVRVQPAFPQHGVQHAVEQLHIGAGLQRQEEVGDFGGLGAARIGHDDPELRVGGLGVFDAPEQDGVGPGRVAAHNEQTAGMLQVVVAGGRSIGAQGGLVAGNGAAHAQAGIGVQVVGAQQALGQLVKDVIVFRQQLAAGVDGHGIRPVLLHGIGHAGGRQVQRGVPVCGLGRLPAPSAQQRLQQPGLPGQRGGGGQVQRAALGAQAAVVGGVQGIAAHAGDLRPFGLDDHTAADAAVGAGGTGFGHGVGFPRWGAACADGSVHATMLELESGAAFRQRCWRPVRSGGPARQWGGSGRWPWWPARSHP